MSQIHGISLLQGTEKFHMFISLSTHGESSIIVKLV